MKTSFTLALFFAGIVSFATALVMLIGHEPVAAIPGLVVGTVAFICLRWSMKRIKEKKE